MVHYQGVIYLIMEVLSMADSANEWSVLTVKKKSYS